MKIRALYIAMAAVLSPALALGGPITYVFSSGDRSATADFVRSGSNLIITLTNTSTATHVVDTTLPTDMLTAIFFDVVGNDLLTPISALVPGTSSIRVGGTGALATSGNATIQAALTAGNVGGEFAYKNSLNVNSNNEGVSSAGFSIFGPGNLFPGPDLVPPANPDGINLGISGPSDALLNVNGGLSGQWLIKSSVVFTLSGFTGEPDEQITDAFFQYGTDLSEPGFPADAPEPSSLVLAALGLIGLAAWGWRRKR